MGMYIGGIDPIKLNEGILNALIKKGIITREEAEEIVKEAKKKD
ncbi:MAG: hypothetical protein WC356_04405 [Candidatus Micrarchaeia archaeon]|jgi:hypothetical protein